MPPDPSGARPRTAARAGSRGNVSGHDRVTEWALAAGRGDAEALERFIDATRAQVRRYVARAYGDTQSTDDLTQETYLRALGSLPRFAARSPARVWLHSIARRVVVDRHRSDAARPPVVASPDWPTMAERRQSVLPGFEEGLALLDLLAGLDTERRQSFVLTQVVGLTYDEAATVAGCPVGTVRSRVSRARRMLVGLLHDADAAGRERPRTVSSPEPPRLPSRPGQRRGVPVGEP